MLLQKISEAAAAHFFFAFDEEGKIHRQLRSRLEIRLDRFQVRKVLPFVVTRPTPEHGTPFDARFEGRRLPQLKRLRRLHIVMAVN